MISDNKLWLCFDHFDVDLSLLLWPIVVLS